MAAVTLPFPAPVSPTHILPHHYSPSPCSLAEFSENAFRVAAVRHPADSSQPQWHSVSLHKVATWQLPLKSYLAAYEPDLKSKADGGLPAPTQQAQEGGAITQQASAMRGLVRDVELPPPRVSTDDDGSTGDATAAASAASKSPPPPPPRADLRGLARLEAPAPAAVLRERAAWLPRLGLRRVGARTESL